MATENHQDPEKPQALFNSGRRWCSVVMLVGGANSQPTLTERIIPCRHPPDQPHQRYFEDRSPVTQEGEQPSISLQSSIPHQPSILLQPPEPITNTEEHRETRPPTTENEANPESFTVVVSIRPRARSVPPRRLIRKSKSPYRRQSREFLRVGGSNSTPSLVEITRCSNSPSVSHQQRSPHMKRGRKRRPKSRKPGATDSGRAHKPRDTPGQRRVGGTSSTPSLRQVKLRSPSPAAPHRKRSSSRKRDHRKRRGPYIPQGHLWVGGSRSTPSLKEMHVRDQSPSTPSRKHSPRGQKRRSKSRRPRIPPGYLWVGGSRSTPSLKEMHVCDQSPSTPHRKRSKAKRGRKRRSKSRQPAVVDSDRAPEPAPQATSGVHEVIEGDASVTASAAQESAAENEKTNDQ